MNSRLDNFTDVLSDEIDDSQPLSLSYHEDIQNVGAKEINNSSTVNVENNASKESRPSKGTGQRGQFRSVEEIDRKYRDVFTYPYFNIVQSKVIDDAVYSDKSMVVCAPTGSGKTVIFEMAIVHLLREMEDKQDSGDFKIIYMAPVKALCTERLSEWYPKFTKLGLLCIEVTGDTDVDFNQLSPYRIIITTPEKWDMLTRRWRDHRQLVEVIKLFLIDEVHILNDETRGPVLEAVVSRMKTIESSAQSAHRIEKLQNQNQGSEFTCKESPPKIRFIAVSATVSNPEDVAQWLGNNEQPAVHYKFGDECRPVKLKRIVEGYSCPEGASIFKFDIILSYKIWPIIQKYHDGKPTLIFCNTRKSVILTAETLSREITINFNPEQKAKLTALASTMKNKKLQTLILSGVGCHHAGLLYEERTNIELAFKNRDLPILITTTTLAMGVNLPAHLVIIKNTQQYVNGAYQEYSISTILQMVGRAGRPQFDTEATAVIMTRLCDKPRYQALVGGSEPLQSYLHKRLPENLNSEAALGTVSDVAQCVQWLRSTFLFVRAARDPRRYLGLPQAAPQQQISKKIEELCVKAMNGLASAGLITMDEASCIESTEAGKLMSIFYVDLETMKHIMKINGSETLDQLLWIVCECHELSDMHLRVDERRYLNALNRNNSTPTIRFNMKGKITTRQMKLYCIIQAILGCLPISDPSLNQEAMKIMRIADRVCRCLLAYITSPNLISSKPKYYSAVLNSITLAKCVVAHLWENSPYVSRQLKGIGPTFSTLLATAGKVNFMLLEESHPRDLERIMNKGPPAGNILRKQVSLLPKYQLTMTPVDQKTVSLQLDLLNCNNLLENIEQLTAGSNHKCYIVVGDSENHVLLVTSFTDNYLISVYNGILKYEITRLHNFEHKIFAHCVSSTFAGIDVQSEYTFTSLEPFTRPSKEQNAKNSVQKQTTITDTFKERKRKYSDFETTQSKEKKIRNTLLNEKFKTLTETYGKTSNELDRTAKISTEILQNQINVPANNIVNCNVDVENMNSNLMPNIIDVSNIDEIFSEDMIDEDIPNEEILNDDKINDLLNEIENEISYAPKMNSTKDITNKINSIKRPAKNNFVLKNSSYSLNKKRQNKPIPKSNYNFIDLLERNTDLNDELTQKQETAAGFSENIKEHINNYMNKLQNKTLPDNSIAVLIGSSNATYKPDVVVKEQQNINSIKNIITPERSNVEPLSELESEIIENSQQQAYNIDVKIVQKENNINYQHSIEKELRTVSNIDLINNNKHDDSKSSEATLLNKAKKESIHHEDPMLNQTAISQQENKNLGNKINSIYAERCFINFDKTEESNVDEKESTSKTTIPMNIIEIQHAINSTVEKYNSDQNKNKSKNNKQLPKLVPNPFCNASALMNRDKFRNNYCNKSIENAKSYQDYLQVQNLNNYNSGSKFIENTPIEYLQPEDENVDKLRHKDNAGCSNPSKELRKDINPLPNLSRNYDRSKTYSYSTTKIDVITKEKADHILHVIRKVKIDLDVTEIPKESKMNKQDDKYEPNKNSSDKDINESIKLPICKKILNDISMKSIEDGIPSRNSNLSVPLRKNIIEENNSIVPHNSITASKDSKSFTNILSTDIEEANVNENDNQRQADNVIDRTDGQKKTISSILAKYSKILRDNKDTEEICTPEKPDKNTIKKIDNNLNSQKSTTKRPFSIKNIELTKPTTLPKYTIDKDTKSSGLVQSNVCRNEELCLKMKALPKLSQFPEVAFHNVKEYSNAENNLENIENIDMDIVDDLPILPSDLDNKTVELNIDQSMLNPKTVLQCFTNEDIIVPPPPEFSDFVNNEENLSPNNVNFLLNNSFEMPIVSNSLPQSDFHVNLTPSKEIEVWNLSQEDRPINNTSIYNFSSQYSKPCTQQKNVISLPFNTNRNARLKQFMLPSKKKLKHNL